jgi:AraC-like DNA-binding protein
MKTFLTTIVIAGSIQGFFLSLVIFKNTEVKKASKFFLIAILIFFSISIILNEIIQNISNVKSDFLLVAGSFQFFLGPMIYFYVRSLTDNSFRHKKSDFYHFIPMGVYVVFIVLIHIRKELIPLLGIINKIMWGLIIIQFFLYLFVARKKILIFNIGLKEKYSSVEKLNLNWLNFLFISLLILLILYFSLFIVILNNFDNTIVNKLMSLFLAFFIYLLGYKGLQQKSIPIGKSDNKAKYFKSLLPPEYGEYWKNKLVSILEKEKSYLDPELSLPMLAGILGIPPNKLSQVINNNLGTTFYDLINKYRIGEVKRLLLSGTDKSILELSFESGFNSKTAFNVIFRKATGVTPSQYKKFLETSNS